MVTNHAAKAAGRRSRQTRRCIAPLGQGPASRAGRLDETWCVSPPRSCTASRRRPEEYEFYQRHKDTRAAQGQGAVPRRRNLGAPAATTAEGSHRERESSRLTLGGSGWRCAPVRPRAFSSRAKEKIQGWRMAPAPNREDLPKCRAAVAQLLPPAARLRAAGSGSGAARWLANCIENGWRLAPDGGRGARNLMTGYRDTPKIAFCVASTPGAICDPGPGNLRPGAAGDLSRELERPALIAAGRDWSAATSPADRSSPRWSLSLLPPRCTSD